ncbi:MAG: hypoxanthine phosphoribosyltransferase [Clostridia bacterium]|nr:hypoxanthine phosphoribosyltransferase [Clostridia bacterium]
MYYDDVIDHIIFTKEQIEERVCALAEQIDKDYAGSELCLVSVLNGSFMFAADLIRRLKTPATISFIYASSYGAGRTQSEKVDIRPSKNFSVGGRNVLIIEDIIDTGRTLKAMKEYLFSMGALSVELCALLDKKICRAVDIEAKYTGFDCPNEFVVGYGLDYNYRYRQFPFVGVLKKEIYSK